MPEAYAHIRTARHAAALCGYAPEVPAAFCAGANGPDPLFYYRFWSARPAPAAPDAPGLPAPDLPALAARLHREQAGAFLLALARLAVTPAQRSYAAGFAVHHALDARAHPYVAAVDADGGPYAGPGGHCRYEAALDTALYRRDWGGSCAPLSLTAPPLLTDQLGEVCALLRQAIAAVYGEQVPFSCLVDTFFDFRRLHRLLRSPLGFNRLLVRLLDAAQRSPHPIAVHVQPQRLRPGLPDDWRDPFDGSARSGGIAAILAAAENEAAGALRALRGYWDGSADGAALAAALGNASYSTGLPC